MSDFWPQVDEEVPDEPDTKDPDDDTDVSHDSLIKRPKGKGASTATKAKAKAKPKKS